MLQAFSLPRKTIMIMMTIVYNHNDDINDCIDNDDNDSNCDRM